MSPIFVWTDLGLSLMLVWRNAMPLDAKQLFGWISGSFRCYSYAAECQSSSNIYLDRYWTCRDDGVAPRWIITTSSWVPKSIPNIRLNPSGSELHQSNFRTRLKSIQWNVKSEWRCSGWIQHQNEPRHDSKTPSKKLFKREWRRVAS